MVQLLASSESCDVSLLGDNHPYWLAYMGEGDSVSFTVPPDIDVKEIEATECLRSVLIVNYTKCTFHIHMHGTGISFNDIDWEGI